MTNQEIFDELGEIGTLLALFLEMGASDGHLDENEIGSVIHEMMKFTNQDLSPFVQSASKIRSKVGPIGMVKYLSAALDSLAEYFSLETKKAILESLREVAYADGVVKQIEKDLFDLAVSKLGM